MVYQSNESGRLEVYAVPFGKGQGKWQISNTGGIWPRWRKDGKEIFYSTLDGVLTAVPVNDITGQLQVGGAHQLFRLPASAYDVSPDGQKFLLNVVREQNAKPITLVTNWTADLKK
jgi:Tol biopolymer transport system component